MTDLHTHILPGIDDGAKNAQESISMLKMEKSQGVNTVVLTPHFYRDREYPEMFISRRGKAFNELKEAIDKLPQKEKEQIPNLLLGSEVTWRGDLEEWEGLDKMCIQGTKNLLIELPFTPWTSTMFNHIYSLLGTCGITPVIAHLDRYFKEQRTEYIQEIFDLGLPIQMSSEYIIKLSTRKKAVTLIRAGVDFIASDCHDCRKRAPNLRRAYKIINRKFGEEKENEMRICAEELAGVVDFSE